MTALDPDPAFFADIGTNAQIRYTGDYLCRHHRWVDHLSFRPLNLHARRPGPTPTTRKATS